MSDFDPRERAVLQQVVAIVPCRNLARSAAFYQQLGFAVTPYEDGTGYMFLERDGRAIHLRLWEGGTSKRSSASGVYVYVDDADVLYDEFVNAGVTCLSEPEEMPWRMREFAVSDPDGTLLRFGHRLP